MSAPNIQGVNVEWGVPTARQAGTGYTTTSAEVDPQSTVKELPNESGQTKTVVFNNPSDKMRLEVYPSGGTLGTLPVIGTAVTVGGDSNWIAMPGTKERWNNEGEKQMTFELQKWPGVTPS